MALNIKMDVKGFEQLRQNVSQFQKEFDEEMLKAVISGAEIVAEDAKRRVHVRTGKLRDSIGVKVYKAKPGYVNVDAGYIHTKDFGPREDRYFVYYELGTSRQKPFHPLRTAKNSTRNQVKAAIQRPMAEFLKRVNKI